MRRLHPSKSAAELGQVESQEERSESLQDESDREMAAERARQRVRGILGALKEERPPQYFVARFGTQIK